MGAGDGSIAGCDATGGDAGGFQYAAARRPARATNLAARRDVHLRRRRRQELHGQHRGRVRLHRRARRIRAAASSSRSPRSCARWAPTAGPPRAENQGFLRPDAFCSSSWSRTRTTARRRPGSGLFDTTSNATLASPLGPPTSFRCNEFGHLCNGVKPPRRAPTGSAADVVTLDGCDLGGRRGHADAGRDDRRAAPRAQAGSRRWSSSRAIAGPPTPYIVHWKNPLTPDTRTVAVRSRIRASASDGSLADPGGPHRPVGRPRSAPTVGC